MNRVFFHVLYQSNNRKIFVAVELKFKEKLRVVLEDRKKYFIDKTSMGIAIVNIVESVDLKNQYEREEKF